MKVFVFQSNTSQCLMNESGLLDKILTRIQSLFYYFDIKYMIVKQATQCLTFIIILFFHAVTKSYLNHDFVTAVELLGNKFLVCGSIWITEKECSNQFCFWLSKQ